jgi:hypothetical protein
MLGVGRGGGGSEGEEATGAAEYEGPDAAELAADLEAAKGRWA